MSTTELAPIDAYEDWLWRLRQRGHALWLCTAQFVDLRVPRPARLAAMAREVERVCRALLTRIVRNPRDDLGAAFAALVIRDARFQRAPTFARHAAALAPLCGGECDMVRGGPA